MHRFNFNALFQDIKIDAADIDYNSGVECTLAQNLGNMTELLNAAKEYVSGSERFSPNINQACVIFDNAMYGCLTRLDPNGLTDVENAIRESFQILEDSREYSPQSKVLGVAKLLDVLNELHTVRGEIGNDLGFNL